MKNVLQAVRLDAHSIPEPSIRVLILGACLAFFAGCAENTEKPIDLKQTYTPEQVAKMLDPNVVGIAALYDSFDPWLWTTSHEKPRGVVIRALYLMGPHYTGIFGDGTIRPRLYLREINEKGENSWTPVKEWSLNVQDAMPFRSKRPTILGWGYRLHLPYDDLPKYAGREVRMVIEFQRTDGRTVTSDKKDFRVPTSNAS